MNTTMNQMTDANSACETTDNRPVAPTRLYKAASDIVDTASEVVLILDVPGSAADLIEVKVEKGELLVSAKVAERELIGHRLVREYGVGDFQRTFHVGEGLDFDQIDASYQLGVLTIRVPKKPALVAKKIVVKSS